MVGEFFKISTVILEKMITEKGEGRNKNVFHDLSLRYFYLIELNEFFLK